MSTAELDLYIYIYIYTHTHISILIEGKIYLLVFLDFVRSPFNVPPLSIPLIDYLVISCNFMYKIVIMLFVALDDNFIILLLIC